MRGDPSGRALSDLLSFGVINLDKPPGPSAHQVAAWVRDMTGQEQAAHSGTLDPKVTGCLPILTGEATRLAQVFDDAIKGYVTVLELHGPAPADCEQVIDEFNGPLYQKPPRKSAVARRLRTRTIHELELLALESRRALLRVECESGTYIRKLCHDLGLAMGTGAHMGDLRRVRTGNFGDRSLVTLHDLADALAWAGISDDEETEPAPDEQTLEAVVQPAERALEPLPRVTMAASAATQVAEGAPLYAPGVLECDPCEAGTLMAGYTPDGAAVCLGHRTGEDVAGQATVLELARVLV